MMTLLACWERVFVHFLRLPSEWRCGIRLWSCDMKRSCAIDEYHGRSDALPWAVRECLTTTYANFEIHLSWSFPTWIGVGDLKCWCGYTSGVDPYSQVSPCVISGWSIYRFAFILSESYMGYLQCMSVFYLCLFLSHANRKSAIHWTGESSSLN